MKSFWAALKNGLYRTFHWFSVQHLQLYLDEFSFRLNEGNYKIDTVDRTGALIRGIGVAGWDMCSLWIFFYAIMLAWLYPTLFVQCFTIFDSPCFAKI